LPTIFITIILANPTTQWPTFSSSVTSTYYSTYCTTNCYTNISAIQSAIFHANIATIHSTNCKAFMPTVIATNVSTNCVPDHNSFFYPFYPTKCYSVKDAHHATNHATFSTAIFSTIHCADYVSYCCTLCSTL
jgi:hypothetical protein